jgi:hypothetical protein
MLRILIGEAGNWGDIDLPSIENEKKGESGDAGAK